jgi:hypothetical protein
VLPLAEKMTAGSKNAGITEGQLKEILTTLVVTLGRLFSYLSTSVESLPFKKQKRIQIGDNPALLAYLTVIPNILQEIRRLNQMPLFNTVAANVDLIVKKMPTSKIEKWMDETERQSTCISHGEICAEQMETLWNYCVSHHHCPASTEDHRRRQRISATASAWRR